MSSTSIESPLLRKIAFLYGNTGVQLHPYSVRAPYFPGCFRLVVNLLINSAIFVNMLTGEQFDSERLIAHLDTAKPFFKILYKLFVSGFFPISTAFTMMHYFLYGPAMMACLDSPVLRRPFENRKVARRYFSALLLFNFLMFLAVNTSNINNYFRGQAQASTLRTLYNITMLYLLSSIRYFQTTLLHYCLHGTHLRLLQLNEQLKGREKADLSGSVLWQFAALAQLNQQLYHLISLQMITFYCLSALNVLIISYIALLIADMYIILVFPLSNIAYILYLIGLNRKVQAQAALIVCQLKHQCTPSGRRSYSTTSRAIRYRELEIYQRCFQLKAFDLTKLNRKFILATALLILNYTIFIYQTQ
ncbi:hypothetical protein TYRP_014286 [Tyrophagus putrescentiae]|nr:hypothetical protein TYRP_014286 [Tyrophagus putrescentiae]